MSAPRCLDGPYPAGTVNGDELSAPDPARVVRTAASAVLSDSASVLLTCVASNRAGLGRKVVIAARLRCRQPASEVGERQTVIAQSTDTVLGLPEAAALDARARVEGIDDTPAKRPQGRLGSE